MKNKPVCNNFKQTLDSKDCCKEIIKVVQNLKKKHFHVSFIKMLRQIKKSCNEESSKIYIGGGWFYDFAINNTLIHMALCSQVVGGWPLEIRSRPSVVDD